jgi:UDP-N-acetylmuramoyl-L-alanyl-D-glutamate--2,6-diaminopimelate ligase
MVFTNLGHEHLTYHGGRENYGATKARLFTEYARNQRPVCAINMDDKFGEQLAKIAEGDVITYGIDGDVSGEALTLTSRGIEGEVCGIPVHSSLLGVHNGSNILGAIALTKKLGIPSQAISDGVSQLTTVPGRLERVANEEGLDVFVDYAHTPESVLVVVLTLKRIFAGRRLIVVVGCGGYSDRAKRPLIAGIAFKNSDVCIITSDNPRHEDPQSIIADMLKGIPSDDSKTKPEVVIDRRGAIQRGVELLRAGGGVMAILGKGHERYQIVGTETFPFDDREVVSEILLQTGQVIPESVQHAAK